MADEISKDVSIEAMCGSCIKWPIRKPAKVVDQNKCIVVKVGGNYDIEGLKVAGWLQTGISGIHVESHSGIELQELRRRCGSPLLTTLARVFGLGEPGSTFEPTSWSDTKNCEAKSSSVTGSWSIIVRDPIPARTRFFATSLASALMVMRRILALRNLFLGGSADALVAEKEEVSSYLLFLSFDAPKADLTIIESNFICV